MTTPAIERVKTYINYMNEDEKNGCNIRERYLFRKIYQAAIDIRYTEEEKSKSVSEKDVCHKNLKS